MFKKTLFSSGTNSSNDTKEPTNPNPSTSSLNEPSSEPDSIGETYSRLGKRSTLLQRLRKSKTEPLQSEKQSSDSGNTNSNSSESLNLPPLSPISLHGFKSSTKHRLLDDELADNIRNILPARYQLFDDWYLDYSLEQHGISLKTLYRNLDPDYQRQLKRNKLESGYADNVVSSLVITHNGNTSYSEKRNHGYVLIIKDENNSKFGCFLNEHLKPMDHKRYYGNGECFLWKVETYDPRKLTHYKEGKDTLSHELQDSNNSKSQDNDAYEQEDSANITHNRSNSTSNSTQTRFKAFMYTGVNDNLIYSNLDFIAVGSSDGKNGLWIDKSLIKGVSCQCDTFGNEILNSHVHDKVGRFKIMGLEIWRIGDYKH